MNGTSHVGHSNNSLYSFDSARQVADMNWPIDWHILDLCHGYNFDKPVFAVQPAIVFLECFCAVSCLYCIFYIIQRNIRRDVKHAKTQKLTQALPK